MPDWDLDAIRHALSVARKHGFAEVELQSAGNAFQAKLGTSSSVPSTQMLEMQEFAESMGALKTGEIAATLVGYYQPADPPLAIGQQVHKGDVVAVITALGLANDVECMVEGEVSAVLVQSGESVQYGQVLAEVRLDA